MDEKIRNAYDQGYVDAGGRLDADGRPQDSRLVARIKILEGALQSILVDAPEEEPEYQDWGGDTEDAENWGGAQEHWRCAEIARKALTTREGW